jgi:hypothetical protein
MMMVAKRERLAMVAMMVILGCFMIVSQCKCISSIQLNSDEF